MARFTRLLAGLMILCGSGALFVGFAVTLPWWAGVGFLVGAAGSAFAAVLGPVPKDFPPTLDSVPTTRGNGARTEYCPQCMKAIRVEEWASHELWHAGRRPGAVQ